MPFDLKELKSKTAKQASQLQTEIIDTSTDTVYIAKSGFNAQSV
jgi:hypothetical protein